MASARQNSSDIRSSSTSQDAIIRNSSEFRPVVPIKIEGPVCLLHKASQNTPPHNAGANQLPHNAVVPSLYSDAPIPKYPKKPNPLSFTLVIIWFFFTLIAGATGIGSAATSCATPGTNVSALSLMAGAFVGAVFFGAGIGSIGVKHHCKRHRCLLLQ
eukprot:GHVT01019417.1.p1 GENE.GHVT01019417.1~~GHVT01019417.1.p1  ORF type:complete len:158 (+),score=6.97 GHVT01019417.1:91-564(+)